MKTTNELNEFIRQLEEAIDNMLDELESEHRQVTINVSVNLCPMSFMNSGGVSVSVEKTPVDVIETEKTILAVVGLPGMEPENISMNCDGKSLEITAANGEKTFNECIELPAFVKKSGMKTTYKNGILEVVFNKRKYKNPKDKA
jgi:HSP20 family molecular chaperone IbpA